MASRAGGAVRSERGWSSPQPRSADGIAPLSRNHAVTELFNPNFEVGTGNSIKVLIGSGSGRRRRGNFAPAGGRRGADGVTRPTNDGLATCLFDFIADLGVRI